MIIEKTLNYTLLINEPEGHGVKFQDNIEDSIAVLMIAAQILESKRESASEFKKQASSKQFKDDIGRDISKMGRAIQSLNSLAYTLCNHYEGYVAEQGRVSAEVREHLQEIGDIPTNDQIKEM